MLLFVPPCRGVAARTLIVLGVMLFAMALDAASGRAQVESASQSCTNCVLYAVTELNLRQEPSLDAAVLRFVPQGTDVLRTTGEESNGYAPVTYDEVPGWVVALGLVASPEEIDAAAGIAPAPETPADPSNARVTLSPLWLRSGPASDAEPILSMPEGAQVTLTREGAESGYVTVDYDGVTGWAYADLLGGETAAA